MTAAAYFSDVRGVAGLRAFFCAVATALFPVPAFAEEQLRDGRFDFFFGPIEYYLCLDEEAKAVKQYESLSGGEPMSVFREGEDTGGAPIAEFYAGMIKGNVSFGTSPAGAETKNDDGQRCQLIRSPGIWDTIEQLFVQE